MSGTPGKNNRLLKWHDSSLKQVAQFMTSSLTKHKNIILFGFLEKNKKNLWTADINGTFS